MSPLCGVMPDKAVDTLMLAFTCVLVAISRLVANRRHRRPAEMKAPK